VSKIRILITHNLRLPNIMISNEIVNSQDYNTLFLNLYEELEPHIKELSKGRIEYEDFTKKISSSRAALQPVSSWLYPLEPIIRAIRKIGRRGVNVYCYKDYNYEKRIHEITTEITILTAKSKIFGKINTEEWKRKIRERALLVDEALRVEARKIHAKSMGLSICISNPTGYRLGEVLSRMGDEVQVEEVMKNYYPTPLEEMEIKLRSMELSDDEIKEYVKEHLEYVEKYVLTSENIDQAYYRWLYDKHPELRDTISQYEIEMLGKLIKR